MKIIVTPKTKNESFASACSHHLHPEQRLPSPFLFEISELADVMDFYPFRCPTDLTRFRQKAFDYFCPAGEV